MAPTTSQPPACGKSWRAVSVNAAQRRSPSTSRPRARVIQASRPTRLQISPTTIEVASEARNRARTILARPGRRPRTTRLPCCGSWMGSWPRHPIAAGGRPAWKGAGWRQGGAGSQPAPMHSTTGRYRAMLAAVGVIALAVLAGAVALWPRGGLPGSAAAGQAESTRLVPAMLTRVTASSVQRRTWASPGRPHLFEQRLVVC
jgi:hypothetical protein